MNTYYVERRGVRKSEAVIDRKELDDLRRLSRRGAAYEDAAKSMRNRQAEVLERFIRNPGDQWAAGWLAAMRELAGKIMGQ